MQITREEILNIAKLANIKLKEEEVKKHMLNLQEVLDFVDIIKKAPIEELTETVVISDNYNVFRKDEINKFENRDILLQNAPDQEDGMFKIPRVL